MTDDDIERINEATDDGTGCGGMWETMSNLRESGSTSRRRFLEVGAAGVSLTMLGSGTVAAEDETTPYTELSDTRARRVLSQVQDTTEYQRLEQLAADRGQRLSEDAALAGVVEGTSTYQMVSVPLEGTDADRGFLTVRREVGGGVDVAELEYVFTTDRNVPYRTEVADVVGGVSEETHELTQEQVDALEGGDVRNLDDVMPQFSIKCDGCKSAIGLICQIGCGASTAFICGVLSGANIIAGGACFTFTQVACGLIATFGCGAPAEDICAAPELDLC